MFPWRLLQSSVLKEEGLNLKVIGLMIQIFWGILTFAQQANPILIIGTVMMPAPDAEPRHRHTCNQSKEIPCGWCCNNNTSFLNCITQMACVRLPFSRSEHVWHHLGNGTVKRAEIVALKNINTADVPYFRWTNNSQLIQRWSQLRTYQISQV